MQFQQQLSRQFKHFCRTRQRRAFATQATSNATMVGLSFQQTALNADQRLTLSGACAATLPEGHSHDVLLFGGYHEAPDKQRACTNSAWIYSAKTAAWEPVQYASGAVPQPRLVSQAVIVGSKLWIIGGWDSSISGPDAFLGDVWTLDLDTWAWQQQQLAGNSVLQGVSRHQAAAVGQHVYIHTHRTTDHILRLDTSASPPLLEQLPVTGPAPSSRGLHSMVHVDGHLYVLFGAPQKGAMLDDVYRLDLASLAWEELSGKVSGPKPHPRCSAAVGAVGDKILVVGGAFYGASGGLEMLQDAYVLDTSSSSWLVPELAGACSSSDAGSGASGGMPSARNAAVMVPLRAGAAGTAGGSPQLLLAGGWRAFVETYNDTYLATLS
ncbi:galactose oxidase [Scenedesmus sp. NREL 46B-D3]|nr:galactose oxidase [Scenedesmus sp. NREL 46B-D3]